MRGLDDGPDGLREDVFDVKAKMPAADPARKAAAQERIRAATEHIEKAQQELDRACQALSSLCWMQPELDRVGKLRERIKEQFYRLSKFSHTRVKAAAKAELDHEPSADEHAHKGCCR